MIYAPAFHGFHDIYRYKELRKELKEKLCPDLIIDLDLLFDKEIDFYFNEIFPNAWDLNPNNVYLRSSDIKRIRKVRKILRKYIIPVSKIFKDKYLFLIGVKYE